MSGPTYQNVYNFSTNLTAGFLATLTVEDGSKVPYDFTGNSATMALIRQSDHLAEFTWTTANGNITLHSGGQLTINIATADMTPNAWLTAIEQYPSQVYNYTLSIFDANNVLRLAITGVWTVYQF